MRRTTDSQISLASEDQAIGHGQTLGMSAWESFLPHEMFEEVLKVTTGTWRKLGIDPAWIAAGEKAARAAFRGS
jgi:hypothetical protein